ncbi:MAG: hypothetical protein ACYDH9_01945 [Limisphaerales bacterium]
MRDLLLLLLLGVSVQAQTLGNHPAVYDKQGVLLPWTSWRDAIGREVNWYLNCPIEHGYPRFVFMTFMRGDYRPDEKRLDFIPAMQNGMGIISYLKYYAYTGRQNPKVLQFARSMGDYLAKENLTPDTGKYPRFPRSTGRRAAFPQPPDCGSQADRPYEIQPDKGGIAGYALMLLYEETKDETYFPPALQVARVLAANMREGTATNSPWPFRADYRSGAPRGEVSANMSFILRLFDKLIEHRHQEFQAPRDKLWAWIKTFQLANLARDGLLWVQFFEDYDLPGNRNSWAPMNLARYLIEKKAALDPDWQADARALIEFVNRRFTGIYGGILVCGEQDGDRYPWGGAVSTYGAVLALYTQATDSLEYKGIAYQVLNYALYSIDDDGCPSEAVWKGKHRGGWQEDAHTDKLHNFVDAMTAFPEWAQ